MGGCAAKPQSTAVSLSKHEESPQPRVFAGAHADRANAIAAGGTGEWLTCAEDKKIALVDWHGGRVVQCWEGHDRGVNCVAASGSTVISGSRDQTVRVWQRGSLADCAATLRGHELTVSAVTLAADGAMAVSGSRDSSLRLWDIATSSCAHHCHVSRNVVTCLRWVPGEAQLIAQGSEDLRLRLWDVRTLSKAAAVLEGYVYFPLCCDCAGPYVLTGSNGFNSVGCELRLWDRRTLKEAVHQMTGHEQAVKGVALLRSRTDGGLVAASGCTDGELRLWDTTSGVCTARCKLEEGVTGVAAAPEECGHLYACVESGSAHALRTDVDASTLGVIAMASAAAL